MASAPRIRKRARTATSERSAEMDLQTVVDEIHFLREEHAHREQTLMDLLRRREKELSHIRQLSLSNNINIHRENESEIPRISESNMSVALGYKLKPDTYNGSAPLREFFLQFFLIARGSEGNCIPSSLRGRARFVLQTIKNAQNLNFEELKSRLELKFGEGHSSPNYYLEFTNRKQKFGENLAFAGELEKLAQLAYPECAFPMRDKITCAQFVSALSNNFI